MLCTFFLGFLYEKYNIQNSKENQQNKRKKKSGTT
jgi:hypothetical protein